MIDPTFQATHRRGVQVLRAGPRNNKNSDHDASERNRIMQSLPSSIQGLLARTTRILSMREIRLLLMATGEHRYETLRMVFEGHKADEAIAYLIRVTEERTRAHLRDPPPIRPSAAVGRSVGARRVRARHGALPTARRLALHCSGEFTPPTLGIGIGAADDFSLPLSSVLTCASGASDRSPSPMIRVPSPRWRASASPQEPSPPPLPPPPTAAPAAAAAAAAFGPKAPAAWDTRYQTFIVHPNQLRRLEAKDRRERGPAAVPDALRFTRQSSNTNISAGVGGGGGGGGFAVRAVRPQPSPSPEKLRDASFVPPLAIPKVRRVRSDVFSRLYSPATARPALSNAATQRAQQSQAAGRYTRSTIATAQLRTAVPQQQQQQQQNGQQRYERRQRVGGQRPNVC